MEEFISPETYEEDLSYLFPKPEPKNIVYLFIENNNIVVTSLKENVPNDYIEINVDELDIPLDIYLKKFYIDNGTIKEDESLLLDYLKSSKLQELNEKTTQYIFNQYPDIKQRSDINDYFTYKSIVLSYLSPSEFLDFEAQISSLAENYFTDLNTTFDALKQQIQNPVDENNNPKIPDEIFSLVTDQLLKYFIRQLFVHKIKILYREFENVILQESDYIALYTLEFDFSTVRDIVEV